MDINTVISPEEAKLRAIAAQNRTVLRQYKEYFCDQLFTVISWNPDLTYKEDKMNGKNTFIRENFLYKIEAIDVIGLNLVNDLNGNPKVEFNGRADLRYDIVPPTFAEVSCATVKDAVDAYINKKAPIFFPPSQYAKLVAEVTGANEGTMRFYEEQAKKALNLAKTSRDVNEATQRAYEDYLRQLGINNADSATVRVTVTEE